MEGLFEAARLKGNIVQFKQKVENKNFSDEAKSSIFLREGFKSSIKCSICQGYLEPATSGSYDHIVRKSEGGLGEDSNGQLAHPYCNTGYKN